MGLAVPRYLIWGQEKSVEWSIFPVIPAVI